MTESCAVADPSMLIARCATPPDVQTLQGQIAQQRARADRAERREVVARRELQQQHRRIATLEAQVTALKRGTSADRVGGGDAVDSDSTPAACAALRADLVREQQHRAQAEARERTALTTVRRYAA